MASFACREGIPERAARATGKILAIRDPTSLVGQVERWKS